MNSSNCTIKFCCCCFLSIFKHKRNVLRYVAKHLTSRWCFNQMPFPIRSPKSDYYLLTSRCVVRLLMACPQVGGIIKFILLPIHLSHPRFSRVFIRLQWCQSAQHNISTFEPCNALEMAGSSGHLSRIVQMIGWFGYIWNVNGCAHKHFERATETQHTQHPSFPVHNYYHYYY